VTIGGTATALINASSGDLRRAGAVAAPTRTDRAGVSASLAASSADNDAGRLGGSDAAAVCWCSHTLTLSPQQQQQQQQQRRQQQQQHVLNGAPRHGEAHVRAEFLVHCV